MCLGVVNFGCLSHQSSVFSCLLTETMAKHWKSKPILSLFGDTFFVKVNVDFHVKLKVVIMDSGENQNYHVNQARFISPLLKPMHLSKKKKKNHGKQLSSQLRKF